MEFIPVARENFFKILCVKDAVIENVLTEISSNGINTAVHTIIWTQKRGATIGKIVSICLKSDSYYLTRCFWNELKKNKKIKETNNERY